MEAVHVPSEQTGVCDGHTMPQPPQLFESESTSMQALPQYSVPTVQQFPFTHHCVESHAFAHVPQ